MPGSLFALCSFFLFHKVLFSDCPTLPKANRWLCGCMIISNHSCDMCQSLVFANLSMCSQSARSIKCTMCMLPSWESHMYCCRYIRITSEQYVTSNASKNRNSCRLSVNQLLCKWMVFRKVLTVDTTGAHIYLQYVCLLCYVWRDLLKVSKVKKGTVKVQTGTIGTSSEKGRVNSCSGKLKL